MNLLSLRTRVANQTGLNPSNTNDATKIDAWLNQTYQHVSGLYNWPWLVKQGTLVLSADITTGTVTVNAASTSLTFSSGPAASVANDWMIRFAASNDWYDISAHTAASTSATLATAYNASSNLTAGTYTLRRLYYSLPSDLDRIIDARQMRSEVALTPVDVRLLDMLIPNPNTTGDPAYFALFGLDSNKYWRLTPYPVPSTSMNLLIRYFQKITEMSATTDEPLIPTKWHNVLVQGALYYYGYPFIDDTRQSEAKVLYEGILKEMEEGASPIPAANPQPIPWDKRPRAKRFGLQFPTRINV